VQSASNDRLLTLANSAEITTTILVIYEGNIKIVISTESGLLGVGTNVIGFVCKVKFTSLN